MAITKIAGELLESNLIRSSDLAFNTDLLYLDVDNGRIGVKTSSPGDFAIDVNGTARFQGNVLINADLTVTGTTTTIDSQNLVVEDNIITSNENASQATDAGIMIKRSAADNAVFFWDETNNLFKVGTTPRDGSTTTDFDSVTLSKIQIGEPTADSDASTKKYVDDQISTVSAGGGVTGMGIDLDNPTDSSFSEGAYLGLTTSTKVTNAIDELNEVLGNVQAGTYLKSVSFIADSTSISANDTVTLTITTTPTAGADTRYTITWGDGNTDTASSDSTPSHTYSSGGTFSVTVKAFENDAGTTDSAGSFATSTRTNYIVASTAAPVVSFQIHSSDDSASNVITKADNGTTVYLQNNTTNSADTATFDVDWGDGSTDTIASNGVDGGVAGGRLAHTYTNSAGDDGSTVAGTGTGDTKYAIKLRLLTHPTADAATFPQTATNNFEVYSTHTPLYSTASSTIRGINEESTSGFPVTFTNDTATNPGANSAFSATQQYTWNFGEGDSNTVVAVGSGSSGDTGQTINNTFNLSTSEQNAGTTVIYNTSLSLATGHSSTPFASGVNIIVEPDVRANIAGVAVTPSTASGDTTGRELYDLTDLDGTDRAIARFTNTSKNADNYVYDFFDDSSSLTTVAENGSNAGSIGATIDKDYSGTSAGNINFRFRASGQPDTFFQDDEETITFEMKATPSAPGGLSSKTLTLNTNAQGTNPHLCHNADDATGSASTLSAGDSLQEPTARRYTSTTPVETNTVTDFLTNDSNGTGSTVNQTVTASINASASGARAFTTAEGGSNDGTHTKLVISNHRDFDAVDGAYPQRLYLVATAKVSQALTDFSTGVNAVRIESSAGGNTGYVHVVKDLLTGAPTTTIGTLAEGTAGSKRYISGIPYYNSGSPTVTIGATGSKTTVANFTGQAYQDTASPHEVAFDSNHESTTGNVLASNPTQFTYANIDGSSTMLNSGIPVKNTGVGSAYTLGALTVPLTSSSRRSIQTIKALSRNANGDGGYSSSSTKIQVYTDSLLTLDNEAGGITVSDSLGAGFDDDAVRISGFGSLSSDTPSLFDSSNANYYTDSAWSGAVTVAGTNEAISRFGTIKHFTTDLSSGYLPVGPDLNTGRDGGEAQYYTFAFRRTGINNFNLTMSGKVSGMFIAMPGNTTLDAASGGSDNGWLNCSATYEGAGVPGSDLGNGGNGGNGCAFNSGDRVVDNTTYSAKEFTFTFGTEGTSNTSTNVVLIRIKLESGDSVTALAID